MADMDDLVKVPFGGMGKLVNQNGFSDHFPIAVQVREAARSARHPNTTLVSGQGYPQQECLKHHPYTAIPSMTKVPLVTVSVTVCVPGVAHTWP
jgi:hypothetical protein